MPISHRQTYAGFEPPMVFLSPVGARLLNLGVPVPEIIRCGATACGADRVMAELLTDFGRDGMTDEEREEHIDVRPSVVYITDMAGEFRCMFALDGKLVGDP